MSDGHSSTRVRQEKPILFSGPMVKAIIAGRKTMTRRVVKRDRKYGGPGYYGERWHIKPHPRGGWWATDGDPNAQPIGNDVGFACPYGAVGTRLWVREQFRIYEDDGSKGDFILHYRADDYHTAWIDGELKGLPMANGRWRPSIHMPRWASRITLEVTGVRVERLQDITEEDAKAEGVQGPQENPVCVGDCRTHYSHFRELWDSINAARGYSWESNPWVWAISFRRVP